MFIMMSWSQPQWNLFKRFSFPAIKSISRAVTSLELFDDPLLKTEVQGLAELVGQNDVQQAFQVKNKDDDVSL